MEGSDRQSGKPRVIRHTLEALRVALSSAPASSGQAPEKPPLPEEISEEIGALVEQLSAAARGELIKALLAPPRGASDAPQTPPRASSGGDANNGHGSPAAAAAAAAASAAAAAAAAASAAANAAALWGAVENS